jgi:hypothetical protein
MVPSILDSDSEESTETISELDDDEIGPGTERGLSAYIKELFDKRLATFLGELQFCSLLPALRLAPRIQRTPSSSTGYRYC